MSLPNLQAYPYSEVANLLPQDRKEKVERDALQSRVNHNNWTPINYGPPIACAIGVIVCLGAVFLTLAVHQVLPHGINAISELGVYGEVLAYGGLGIGAIVILIGGVKWYLNKQKIANAIEEGVASTRYNSESSEVEAYFRNMIEPNELLAVNNPERQEISIYYQQWNETHKLHLPMNPETFEYDADPEVAFQNWCETHSSIVQGKRFIDLDVVRQRTETFERKKIYSLDVVIEQIRLARSQGTQTALFLGRTNDQSMPVEEGWAWFSLDEHMEPENRGHHLQINFNEPEIMQKIHNLFDKVVVDCSVIKFFHDSPWDALQPLLFKDKSSELIVETHRGNSISQNLLIDGRKAWLQVPFGLSESERSNYDCQFLDAIGEYLETLFHNVELVGGAYPYRDEADYRRYWVASNPI